MHRSIERMLRSLSGRRVEEVVVSSSFMLHQEGSLRRLRVGEKVELEPGQAPEGEEQLTRFRVSPEVGKVRLEMGWFNEEGLTNYFVASEWGNLTKGLGSSDTVFQVALTPQAFTNRGGTYYIRGSRMHFNADNTRLQGDVWILEYKPF